MMQFRNQEENSLNIFVLISLIIHGVLFFTFPQWGPALLSNAPGIEQGGVFRVAMADFEPAREWSPITDPTSQKTTPQVEQAKPAPDPPNTSANAVQIGPDQIDSVVPPVKPRPEPENVLQKEEVATEIPEPETIPEETQEMPPEESAPEPDPEPEFEPEAQVSGLMTGESGREIHIETPDQPEEIIETDIVEPPQEEIVPEEQQEYAEETGLSGSGEFSQGAYDGGTDSVVESGVGQAEQALQPPRLAGGRALFSSSGGLGYPKDAQHLGAEGVVELDLYIGADGRVKDVTIVTSSGEPSLDEYSKLAVTKVELSSGNIDRIKSVGADIIVTIKMMFFRDEDGNFASTVDDEPIERLAQE